MSKDDLLTFTGVDVETTDGYSSRVTGLPMLPDARNSDGCWLDMEHVIINHTHNDTYITMFRWRAEFSCIDQTKAASVHRKV